MQIADCHCHVYPDSLAPKAIKGIASFYGLEMTRKMSERGTVSDMKEREYRVGIGHQIIFSVATTPHQVSSINRFISAEVEASEGTLTGLGTIHPECPDLRAAVDEIIKLGLKGIKIHPDFQQTAADDRRYMKVYEYCEGRLPVLIHCGDSRKDFSNPGRILPVLEAFPALTVIGAHLGGWSVWDESVKVLPHHGNFYVDCSSSFPFMIPEKAVSIIRIYGADRVIFGTDYPLWDPAEELDKLLSLGLNENELELITHKNAEKLFGIRKYAI